MAVMVVDKDDILFSNTYGNCENIDTPFMIGSMSKSFTAIAIMQLVEDGKINLDNSISKYIDAAEWFVQDSDCGKISVRNLLNHTSGITTYQRFGKLEVTDSYGQHVYANANYGLLGFPLPGNPTILRIFQWELGQTCPPGICRQAHPIWGNICKCI